MSVKVKKRLSIVITFGFYIIVVLMLIWKVFSINVVEKDSMLPNITGLTISNRLAYETRDPMRGDVVIFTHNGELLVKRVIGLPGDNVTIWGGHVLVNGYVLDEPYLTEGTITDGSKTYTVPSGMYFVLGDNRDVSFDSRYFVDPFVDRSYIVGRVFYCIPSVYDLPGKVVNQFDMSIPSSADTENVQKEASTS